MRAFVLERAGAEPRLRETPPPDAAAAEQVGGRVVPVHAAGVNPVDLKMADDPARPTPRVVGNEAVVLLDGRRCYAERTLAPHGSFAEWAVVDPAIPIPLPDDVPDDAALAVGIAGLASWLALARTAALGPGETVLVLGATGAVGRIAVQAARLLGAGRVVAAGRNATRLAELSALGADATVPLTGGPDDTAALLDASDGGVDVVLDVLYGEPMVVALGAVRQGGRVVTVGSAAGTTAAVPFATIRGRSLLTHSNQLTDPAPRREGYLRLLEHLRRGEISVETEVLPLAEAAAAWSRQRDSPGTKLVLETVSHHR